MKEYIKVKGGTKVNSLKVEVEYDIGGMNYFTGRPIERGCYLSVIPVERSEYNGHTIEIVAAFSGVSYLLKEVKRKSAKVEKEALEIANKYKSEVIKKICDRDGYTIE